MEIWEATTRKMGWKSRDVAGDRVTACDGLYLLGNSLLSRLLLPCKGPDG